MLHSTFNIPFTTQILCLLDLSNCTKKSNHCLLLLHQLLVNLTCTSKKKNKKQKIGLICRLGRYVNIEKYMQNAYFSFSYGQIEI